MYCKWNGWNVGTSTVRLSVVVAREIYQWYTDGKFCGRQRYDRKIVLKHLDLTHAPKNTLSLVDDLMEVRPVLVMLILICQGNCLVRLHLIYSSIMIMISIMMRLGIFSPFIWWYVEKMIYLSLLHWDDIIQLPQLSSLAWSLKFLVLARKEIIIRKTADPFTSC